MLMMKDFAHKLWVLFLLVGLSCNQLVPVNRMRLCCQLRLLFSFCVSVLWHLDLVTAACLVPYRTGIHSPLVGSAYLAQVFNVVDNFVIGA